MKIMEMTLYSLTGNYVICDQGIILTIFNILGTVISLIRWSIPLALIVWGSFDLGKAIMEKEEKEIKKAYGKFFQKFALTILAFLIPTFLKWGISIFGLTTAELGSKEPARKCIDALFPIDPLANNNNNFLETDNSTPNNNMSTND